MAMSASSEVARLTVVQAALTRERRSERVTTEDPFKGGCVDVYGWVWQVHTRPYLGMDQAMFVVFSSLSMSWARARWLSQPSVSSNRWASASGLSFGPPRNAVINAVMTSWATVGSAPEWVGSRA